MKLYNQLTKKLDEFRPLDPKNVKIYTCGPTVYSYAHIGNFSSYIYWDLLVRTLKANGYLVNRVLNLTDVGHLSSDADDGEDKLEKGAKREGLSVWDVAKKYSDAFLKDFRALNLTEPDVIARATDYIEQDKALVKKLIEKGYTYETSDGIYYDTSKFLTYADFAGLDLEKIKAGARVEFSNEKKNPSDFAVWKFVRDGEDHAMKWDFLGRSGYPGWHLECSTIIKEELGLPIDIHTGGIDHIPVHHTNEIAQTEAAFDVKLAKYWLHCNFITINGEKISKSLGNTYTLDDLKERGFDPLDFKMWVLQGHYRGDRNFSFEDLEAAKTRRLNWRNRIARLYQGEVDTSTKSGAESESGSTRGDAADESGTSTRGSATGGTPDARSRETSTVGESVATGPRSESELAYAEPRSKSTRPAILSAVSNNLNSPEAMSVIDNSDLNLDDWQFIDDLFGLNLFETTPDISNKHKAKIAERESARKNKDFEISDRLRAELEKEGITVLDTSDGPIWQYLA